MTTTSSFVSSVSVRLVAPILLCGARAGQACLARSEVSPKHTHPGEEIVYVLEGSLEYQVEGKPPMTLDAGDVLFIPTGAIHTAKNVGSGNGAELATYVVEKGKPLVVWVE
jgi:quercetin dioxygenase-like cupin family protein